MYFIKTYTRLSTCIAAAVKNYYHIKIHQRIIQQVTSKRENIPIHKNVFKVSYNQEIHPKNKKKKNTE